ncbi:cation-transporting P-type ATPase [Amphibacillus sp. Q70]|uniref:cation-transporting P-type ATPase n=1 Tax=Amphibacillus sp. Q70 TaxID=3453416 RepID=UPI003F86D62C
MSDEKWFNQEVDQVIEKLKTNETEGLSQSDIKTLQDKWGKNELPEAEKTPEWKKFIRHFHDVLIYILMVAALITIILGHFVDTIVIMIVVIINALIGYIQENRAEKALESIRDMLSLEAVVIRDNERKEIASEDIVPGDLILLKAGDKIPADLRLIKTNNLNVEESPLTGESTSVEKSTDTLPEDTVLGDQTNMAFSGTSITSGTGRGIVIRTGEHTEIGKINTSMSEIETVQTPLLKQTAQFGKMVSIAIVGLAILLFIFGFIFHDYELGELLLSTISLTVAAIPEGLPAILSIILAIGVQELAGRNAIMRTLPSVETLGAVNVICSDKTGTLTRNEMTVQAIVLSDRELKVTGTGYQPDGQILEQDEEVDVEKAPVLKQFLTSVLSINDTELRKNDSGEWGISGEPTEGCLVTLAEKSNHKIARLPIISKIPFDSSYKYMAGLVEENHKKIIYVKGAPDRLFEMAGLEEGSAERDYWEKKVIDRSKQGERVIASAYKEVDSSVEEIDHADVEQGLTMLGMAGIMDPPREEAIDAVRECKRAGIRVKMITGDHKETAVAIAKEMKITDHDEVIEGRELDKMDQQELQDVVSEVDVFARTSPENKLKLVKALQANEQVIAMTGDGVNDAPALKRADIGVAMGIKGTEVAKEASKMVLVDDNFRTIVNAVREGRRVYDNLKKTILFILPTNGAEAFLVMSALLLGLQMPMTPVQILYVNMITAITVSFALAFEKLEVGTMDRPPRRTNARLLSNYYIFRIVLVSLLVGLPIMLMNSYMLANPDVYTMAEVNTVTLQAIVFSQLFHMFNVRNERRFAFNKDFFTNKVAFIVSGILIVVQLAITYIPFFHSVLGLSPIGAQYWLFPILLGIAVFIIVECEKYITNKVLKVNQVD